MRGQSLIRGVDISGGPSIRRADIDGTPSIRRADIRWVPVRGSPRSPTVGVRVAPRSCGGMPTAATDTWESTRAAMSLACQLPRLASGSPPCQTVIWPSRLSLSPDPLALCLDMPYRRLSRHLSPSRWALGSRQRHGLAASPSAFGFLLGTSTHPACASLAAGPLTLGVGPLTLGLSGLCALTLGVGLYVGS